MAKILKSYLNKITSLEERIDKDVEDVLKVVDIDTIQETPEAYMRQLGTHFFESLDDEIAEAIKAGEDKANAIIRNIK